MDNKNMAYRARLRVLEGMADPRIRDILHDMKEHRRALFDQSVNTAYLAAQIAEAMDYKGDVPELVTAALVHDAGMLQVPDDIFNKQGRLSIQEQEIVQRHVADGAEYLEALGFGDPVIQAARMHHERSDGSGYPRGIESPDIPRHVKIIMVCDVYEALTSERPQRKAFNLYEACSMMSGMPLSRATLQAIKRCDDA